MSDAVDRGEDDLQEAHQVILRPEDEAEGPDVLREMLEELKEQLSEGIPEAADSGRRWFRGRAAQQTAQAAYIRSQAAAQIAKAQRENERLRIERDEKIRADQIAAYNAETERVKAMAEVMKIISDMKARGHDVDIDSVFAVIQGTVPLPGPESGVSLSTGESELGGHDE